LDFEGNVHVVILHHVVDLYFMNQLIHRLIDLLDL